MINVSNEFKETMKKRRDFQLYAEVVFEDGRAKNLGPADFSISNNSITDAASVSTFPLGIALAKCIQLEIINDKEQFADYVFLRAEITLRLKLRLSNTTETIKKGKYTVTTPEIYGSTIIVEAIDDMYKADADYNTGLTFPSTIGTMYRDICLRKGFSIGAARFRNDGFVVLKKPEGVTEREVLGYIAMLAGGNARFNYDGFLEIKTYDLSAFDSDSDSGIHDLNAFFGPPQAGTEDITITGISTIIDEDSDNPTIILEGEEGYAISIKNPLIQGAESQAVSLISEILIGMHFRKFSGEYVSDPTIEFMDLAYITVCRGEKSSQYQSIVTDVIFKMLGTTSLSNSAEDALRNGSRYSSEVTKMYAKARQDASKELDSYDLTVQQMTQLISQAFGMYMTGIKQEDGSIIYYMHDKPTIEESTYTCYWTSEGIISSLDGGTTWAVEKNGNALFNVITSRGLNADWINTGELAVRDENGNVIFSANINTGQVIISGDSVRIGSQSAAQIIQAASDNASTAVKAAQDALLAASSARNMIMRLDNDYQSIPVDDSGNYTEFPVCTVSPIVMYGSEDITRDCVFTVAKSASVTGSWNNTARTYTVTGLIADTGWVDIRATYVQSLSVTKKFQLTKLYAGAAGRTYILDSSAQIVKMSKDSTFVPDSIHFAAYYRDGTDVDRVDYAGRFLVQETADGINWTTVYESQEDEHSINHILYTLFSDGDGSILADARGSCIGMPMDIAEIRVSLFAAGGMDTELESINLVVVKDVDALTHEEIFGLLTNNGEIKGIYKEGNQLYISFSYAKGGALTLGGRNNGNGVLQVLDENGVLKAQIDMVSLNVAGGKIILNMADGSFIAQKATIYGGGEFSGDLKAAGGTFTGDLYAVKGTFSGELVSPTGKIAGWDIAETCFRSKNILITPENYVDDTFEDGSTQVCGNAIYARTYYGGTVRSTYTMERMATTENYGTVAQYGYEMASPMFGDTGTGQTDENGECYIFLDDIFAETVLPGMEYQVFLQKEGPGDIWVDLKEPAFFIVKGTGNLKFSWEVKAKQSGYGYERLDDINTSAAGDVSEIDYEKEASEMVAEFYEGLETIGRMEASA